MSLTLNQFADLISKQVQEKLNKTKTTKQIIVKSGALDKAISAKIREQHTTNLQRLDFYAKWKELARILYIGKQHCECCHNEYPYITGMFVEVQHPTQRTTRAYIRREPETVGLPIKIDHSSYTDTIPMCLNCVDLLLNFPNNNYETDTLHQTQSQLQLQLPLFN